jgi:hypothetical protein
VEIPSPSSTYTRSAQHIVRFGESQKPVSGEPKAPEKPQRSARRCFIILFALLRFDCICFDSRDKNTEKSIKKFDIQVKWHKVKFCCLTNNRPESSYCSCMA